MLQQLESISGKTISQVTSLSNVVIMLKILIMILDRLQEKLQHYICQVDTEFIDTHVYSGYTIPPNYDSMIAKLITTAQSREEAISK
jgi:hypothetical protein